MSCPNNSITVILMSLLPVILVVCDMHGHVPSNVLKCSTTCLDSKIKASWVSNGFNPMGFMGNSSLTHHTVEMNGNDS